MTTSTYAIVHIPDNTPELGPTALGAHVTIRKQEHLMPERPRFQATYYSHFGRWAVDGVRDVPRTWCDSRASAEALADELNKDPDPDDLVPCTGGCGDLVPEPEAGDPHCPDCLLATQPADDRAMQQARSSLVRDIAALPDPQYTVFWSRLLREYLADPPADDHDIAALSDAVEDFAQDVNHPLLRPQPSLAPTGPAAPPTRLAG